MFIHYNDYIFNSRNLHQLNVPSCCLIYLLLHSKYFKTSQDLQANICVGVFFIKKETPTHCVFLLKQLRWLLLFASTFPFTSSLFQYSAGKQCSGNLKLPSSYLSHPQLMRNSCDKIVCYARKLFNQSETTETNLSISVLHFYIP